MLTDLKRLKGEIYDSTKLQGGTASISLVDRDTPFYDESQLNEVDKLASIIFDFKPSNKQFDFEMDSRSGGEKSIAGLALLFSLAI